MDFTDKVAVVTGGGNGIGRAACLAFAHHGASVAVVDMDEKAAEETVEHIRRDGGKAFAIRCDVTNSDDVRGYVEATISAYGRIDCFFNNAGIGGKLAPTAECDEAMFDAVIAVNVKGAFLGLRHVLPQMIQQGSGAIVNTASAAGIVATPCAPAYVASKHAVIGLTKTAAGEVARQGVRVNAVCPGPVDTRAIRWIEEQVSPGDPDAVAARNRAAQPTGRYTRPEEVANVVLFLCSDLSGNTTGTQFVIDGGRLATGGAATSVSSS